MRQLEEKHGMTLPGNTPPGTCPWCAVAHDHAEPHNQQSLTWQYTYYDQHGRFPTWADAMAHCVPEVKAYWTEVIKEHGIEVGAGGVAVDEIVITVKGGGGND